MSRIEKSGKKESVFGRFKKEESLQRLRLFLEPVFIFKYCTRSQLEEIGKKVLGFRAVRWLVNHCVQTGYLAVYKEYKDITKY